MKTIFKLIVALNLYYTVANSQITLINSTNNMYTNLTLNEVYGNSSCPVAFFLMQTNPVAGYNQIYLISANFSEYKTIPAVGVDLPHGLLKYDPNTVLYMSNHLFNSDDKFEFIMYKTGKDSCYLLNEDCKLLQRFPGKPASNGLKNINGNGYLTLIYLSKFYTYKLNMEVMNRSSLAVLKGADGKDGLNGVNGEDGTNGKSAYDLWISNGNTGTITTFLAYLKGQKGDKGDKGEQGIAGKDGLNGVCTTTSTKSTKISTIRIYPNPCTIYAYVDFGLMSEYNEVMVNLYNTKGQNIYSKSCTTNDKLELPISSFKSGSYVVRVDSNGVILNEETLIIQ